MLVILGCLLVLTLSGHIEAQRVKLRESDAVDQYADKYSSHLLERKQSSEVDDGTYLADVFEINDETVDEYAAQNADAIRKISDFSPEMTEVLVNITDRAIHANYDRATDENIIYLYARNIGEFLQIFAVLTNTSDVDSLVNETIYYEVRAVDNSSLQDSGLKSALARASAGFHDFAIARGQGSKEKFGVLTILYANNFYRIQTGDDDESNVVTRFADKYSEKLLADDQLRNAFNTSDLTAKQAANLNAKVVREYSSDPEYTKVLVRMIRRAVLKNYDRATIESLISLFGTTVGEYFQLFGTIDKDTTDDRLDELIDQIIKAQKDEIGDATDPMEVLERATKGFQKYLMEMDSNAKEKYPALVTLYANNFYRLP